MTMKTVIKGLGVVAAATGLSVAAMAEETKGTWDFSLGATNNYMFRGISQSDNDPAVFGSVEFGHSGFAVGAWASSIDFDTDPGAKVEIDLYAGYTHSFNDNTSAGIKAIYYYYPGADTPDASYWEFIGNLEHNFGRFTGNLQVGYAPEYFGNTGSATWVSLGGKTALTEWLEFSANAGYQSFDDNALVVLPDYWHGDIGFTATYDIASLDVRYVASDIGTVSCFGGSDTCDDTLVVTLSIALSSGGE